MADPHHLEILKRGVRAWNEWRARGPHSQLPDLQGANLANADLEKFDFTRTDLDRATMANTTLVAANFHYARVTRTNLRGAKPIAASFVRADLRKSDFGGTSLQDATFKNAIMHGADFTGATIGSTTFGAVDLSQVRGLDSVSHWGPSTIGIDTLYESKGIIPEVFLRGCGLRDEMIELARRLVVDPVESKSCFISYSTKNERFAQQLYNDLQAAGVRCWFAPHDIKGGRKLHEQIDQAIRIHDRTLLILSPQSINSAWVKTEIAKARKREIEEKRQVLFPIRLVDFDSLREWEYFDADTGRDYAKEIREYFIPDFSNWEVHDSYQEAFKKLLQDLKGERTTAAKRRRRERG